MNYMGVKEMHLITIPIPWCQMVKCLPVLGLLNQSYGSINSKKGTKSSYAGKRLELLFFREFRIQWPCLKWKGNSLFLQFLSMVVWKFEGYFFGRVTPEAGGRFVPV